MISSGGQSVEGRERRQGLRAAASPVAAVLVLAGIFHFYRGVPNEGVLFVAAGLTIAADGAGRLPTPRPRVFRLPGATVSFAIAVVGGAALALLTPQGAMETVVLAVVGVTAIVIGWLQPVREGDPPQFTGESRDAPAAELSTELDTELTPELTPEFAESSDSSDVAGAEWSRTPPGGSSGASLDDAPRTAERYRRTAVVWCCFGVAVCLFELAVYLLSDPPLYEFQYPTLSTLLEPVVAVPVGRLPLLVGWIVLGFALLRWSQGGTGDSSGRAADGPP